MTNSSQVQALAEALERAHDHIKHVIVWLEEKEKNQAPRMCASDVRRELATALDMLPGVVHLPTVLKERLTDEAVKKIIRAVYIATYRTQVAGEWAEAMRNGVREAINVALLTEGE